MKKTNKWAWLYIAPTLLILTFFLVYPTINTFYLSFFDEDSENFIGLANYLFAFTRKLMLNAFRNNLIWLVIFTTFTVSLGLILAVLLDRVRYEVVAKSIIFLPMAISFVGAGVIWKFVYAYKPAGAHQIGILNAVLSKFPNFQPIAWLVNK